MATKDEKKKFKEKKRPDKVLEKKIPQYIIGAFSIVAALAWNDLIKDLFKKYMSGDETFWYKLLYSVSATIILVVAVVLVYQFHGLYFSLKEKTQIALQELTCYKQAVAVYKNHGYIQIVRSKANELIITVFMYNLRSNREYIIEMSKYHGDQNDNSPKVFSAKTDYVGNLRYQFKTTSFDIINLIGQTVDVYEYDNPNPTYNALIRPY